MEAETVNRGTMNITVLCVGGTIDKYYPSSPGTRDMQIGPGVAPVLFARLAPTARISHLSMELCKDSLDMTEADRADIVAKCRVCDALRIIVTHGTDTIALTAKTLAAAGLGKTIVLTGSMAPWRVRDSDAEFNLGFALAVARTCPPGVYVALQGALFPDGCCRKGPDGIFQATDRDEFPLPSRRAALGSCSRPAKL